MKLRKPQIQEVKKMQNNIFILDRLLASETLNKETEDAIKYAIDCMRIVDFDFAKEEIKAKWRGEK